MTANTDASATNCGHVFNSSATDDLRRLLDERGVEWAEYGDGYTVLWHGGREYTVQPNVCNRLIVTNLTPEQAIEATLGRGTCRPIISDNLAESEGTGDAWADCSECGHLLFVLADPNSEPPNYCPNCGREVVG